MNKTVEKTTLKVEVEVGADLYVTEWGEVRLIMTIYTPDQNLGYYDPDFVLEHIVNEMIETYVIDRDPVLLHIAANEFSRLSDRLRSVANKMDEEVSLLDEDADDLDPYESEDK